ncbi:DNA-3-methyladenine glycosylase I [Oenococcus kitaharae]|uniref:DNA-3-methyladenine glycosylase n=1 Tax=Oenococcus kitaharae DSM 17330 TaxID=1045004 RepID=G9WHZ2_9LACO|nr:DNA-3-methyladenine glycosylase [Oenococcus kitaharae DSM 17330]OEY81797.1 3-methyladenine DNA glycosylase [Oenococcus kitaharae]OEY84028.1 3-methyladenine DNA glycosylase [Oenococcus kitaharae]OEY85615.1 3-methyladenine DNA glycosylase [Oenococcus kitaharae]
MTVLSTQSLKADDGKRRCQWLTNYKVWDDMTVYHDNEWGRPSHNYRYLFELLCLETYQAGLSWEIVLKKRAAFQRAFFNFDIQKVAELTSIDSLMADSGLIRNRLKLQATINNARAVLNTQKQYGSFDNYLWHFTDGQIIDHHITDPVQIPAQNDLSQLVAKQMKKDAFKFTGPVTIYSYLQGAGVINDHEAVCAFNPNRQLD